MCTAEEVGGEAAAAVDEAAAVERVAEVVEEGPPWEVWEAEGDDHRVAARAPRLVPVLRVPAAGADPPWAMRPVRALVPVPAVLGEGADLIHRGAASRGLLRDQGARGSPIGLPWAGLETSDQLVPHYPVAASLGAPIARLPVIGRVAISRGETDPVWAALIAHRPCQLPVPELVAAGLPIVQERAAAESNVQGLAVVGLTIALEPVAVEFSVLESVTVELSIALEPEGAESSVLVAPASAGDPIVPA